MKMLSALVLYLTSPVSAAPSFKDLMKEIFEHVVRRLGGWVGGWVGWYIPYFSISLMLCTPSRDDLINPLKNKSSG